MLFYGRGGGRGRFGGGGAQCFKCGAGYDRTRGGCLELVVAGAAVVTGYVRTFVGGAADRPVPVAVATPVASVGASHGTAFQSAAKTLPVTADQRPPSAPVPRQVPGIGPALSSPPPARVRLVTVATPPPDHERPQRPLAPCGPVSVPSSPSSQRQACV